MRSLNTLPRPLKHGDIVKIVSTARKVTPEELASAKKILEEWGLTVKLGQHVFASDHQFGGTDDQRLEDLQAALDDPNVSAIFCSRGGYGTPRIVDRIQWKGFNEHPKWLVGFSDITVLLQAVQSQCFTSLHAPMPLFFNKPEYQSSVARLKQFLFGQIESYQIETHPFNKRGEATGTLVGGNLSLIANSLGTKTAFQAKGKILFLEDIDEYLYHIDRLMLHLKRSGVLANLNGLVLGYFSDMKDNTVPFGETAYQIVARHVKEYNYPVLYGFPTGHEAPNMPLPVGMPTRLRVQDRAAMLEFL